MSELKNGQDDSFLTELETAIRGIIKNRKTSKADKLAAVNAGVKLAAIRHKITGGGAEDEGFFGK